MSNAGTWFRGDCECGASFDDETAFLEHMARPALDPVHTWPSLDAGRNDAS